MSEKLNELLTKLKATKDLVKQGYEPLFTKDPKIGKTFKDFDQAVEDRVKEIGGNPT